MRNVIRSCLEIELVWNNAIGYLLVSCNISWALGVSIRVKAPWPHVSSSLITISSHLTHSLMVVKACGDVGSRYKSKLKLSSTIPVFSNIQFTPTKIWLLVYEMYLAPSTPSGSWIPRNTNSWYRLYTNSSILSPTPTHPPRYYKDLKLYHFKQFLLRFICLNNFVIFVYFV